MSDEHKKIDSDKFGFNNQNQAQKSADNFSGDNIPPAAHDPFPARKSKQAAIKTYKDYAAESLSKGGGSLTKMIIAERDKKDALRRKSGSNPGNVALSVLSIVFVLLGLATVVGAFFLVSNWQESSEQKRVPLTPKPLLLYDYRGELYIDDPTRSELVRAIEQQIEDTGIEVGALKYLYFAIDDQFGEKSLMTSDQLLSVLRAKVSSGFVRALADNFMYGIYSTTDNSPFIIFKTDNYDSAYAEILSWERTIGLDIGPILGKPDHDYARANFVDVVYYNRDARAILDTEGNPVIGYSFVDKSTIVFFANRQVLREVITRNQQNTIKE